MAERKAIQKYYPPNWEPKHGSLNAFHRSHPLRQRASKLKTEGILVIRFEMPFNMWCSKCKIMIPEGKRFNAEKKTVGHYFTTPIRSFSMNCLNCGNNVVIQTDPQVYCYFTLTLNPIMNAQLESTICCHRWRYKENNGV